MSIVRDNMLKRPGYTPYCGSETCTHGWPRSKFNGEQFECGCGWRSSFEPAFIRSYKTFNKPPRPCGCITPNFCAKCY